MPAASKTKLTRNVKCEWEVRVSDEQYAWDLIAPELAKLFLEPWGKPIVGLNRRQKVATLFAMRALRRMQAVRELFTKGYYWESHALVRVGYEDWLQLAYLLHKPGDQRCEDFRVAIHKHDARVYDGFTALCGQSAADRFFGEPPTNVSAFVGLPRSKTGPMSFTSMADDVGLRKVHDFAYTYLSGRSHPDGRMHDLFDDSKAVAVARIPERDPAEEARLALWFGWFTGRIVVLASHEFGIDRESFCNEYLLPIVALSGVNLETCVLVREYSGC